MWKTRAGYGGFWYEIRIFLAFFLFSSLFFVPPSLNIAAAESLEAVSETGSTPLSTILNPDASLDPTTGFNGILDVRGYRMVPGRNNEPRFSPTQSDRAINSLDVSSTDTSSNNPDDIYWDDQFTLPGPNGRVNAIAVDESGNIYIGGSFNVVANVIANGIAKWDGVSWSPLGSGLDNFVSAIVVIRGVVYVGGEFTAAGNASVNHIARWDGNSWSPLGSGTDGNVQAIAVNGNIVYVGGAFHTAGGLSAGHIARWDGASWSPLGSGMNSDVFALMMVGDQY